ncbi:imidazole glycerol phosphate synthase subunit HisH [Candidatus Poribacteria bacterium]|nr:imidazole glycerol phosphate synthase subunit HisH [Candidatus Poribacteria bacterium]
MIAIIDYGMGNLRSVQAGFDFIEVEAFITDDPEKIKEADGVILPGVGAFRDAISRLEDTGLGDAFRKAVESGKPCLGICLGLQLLFSESEEGGIYQGLDIIPGRVVRFSNQLKVPHMGWNQIDLKKPDAPIFKDIPDGSYMYFVHSYYVKPDDDSVIAATTEYGINFTSIIAKDNLYATQFHPEKSQKIGLRILRNFGELVRG